MFPPPTRSKTNRREPRAFVLVSVLLLVALATVLVVVAAMMAQVERRAAANAVKIEQARANALFALDAALDQLQISAGPDQRITARADILDSNPSTADINGVNQPYWTGVWKTGNASLDIVSSGTPQRQISFNATSSSPTPAQKAASATWLVSGTNAVNPLTYTPTVASGANSTGNATDVVIARGLGANSQNVTVPIVPMLQGNRTVGAYAYWVSDEGMKAKVNLSNPNFGISPTVTNGFVKNQQQTLISQTMPAHFGILGPGNTTDLRTDEELAKVLGADSLTLLDGVDANGMASGGMKAHAPDLTVHSHGVIADVRNGGLKTDLSSAFEDPVQYRALLDSQKVATDSDRGDAKLFTLTGDSINYWNNVLPYFFGVRWQQLYNYYSLYKNLIPANGFNSTQSPFRGLLNFSNTPDTDSPRLEMQLFQYRSNNNQETNATTPGDFYLPRLLAQSLVLSISSEAVSHPAGTTPASGKSFYRLRIYAEPRVVIYNPYNVTLSNVRNLQLLFGSSLFGGFTATVKAGGNTIINHTSSNPKNLYAGGGFGWRNAPDPARCDITLAPGEIKVLGLSADGFRSDRAITTYRDVNASNQHALTHEAGGRLWTYLPNNRNAADTSANGPGTTAIGGVGNGGAGSGGAGSGGNGTAGDWIGELAPTDSITVEWAPGDFRTNNGRQEILLSPGNNFWPHAGGTQRPTGRFMFFSSNTDTALQTVNLGTVGNMENNPVKFASLVGRAKGIQQARSIDKSTGFEPLPVFASADGNINPMALTIDAASFDVDAQLATNFTSANTLQVNGAAPNLTSFWGLQNAGRNASDRSAIVLADVPRQPALSLGQFMHMAFRATLAGQQTITAGAGQTTGDVETCSNQMVLGGSLANPFLPRISTHGSVSSGYNPGHKTFVMDDNFLMNEALFDRFFLSTVPPASPDSSYKNALPHLVAGGNEEVTDATILDQKALLPNGRMRFYAKNGQPPQMSTSNATNYLPDYQKAAANLLIDGAFNVNSTSVEAWTSFLASLSGNALRFLDTSGGTGAFSNMNTGGVDRVIFTRFASPVIADAQDKDANTLFNGVKALTRIQVRSLAEKIVEQVKTRGPFLSMADFLNRRLEDSDLGIKGALQAAIDNTSINADNLPDVGQSVSATPKVVGHRFKGTGPGSTLLPGQTPRNTAYGVPGWLMQQDLVQAIAPVATVRSDTFIVRTYGEVINPATGRQEARAWGEAVVQRVPDYFDQKDGALGALGDATPIGLVNATNKQFGRSFKVVSFRWLSPNEI